MNTANAVQIFNRYGYDVTRMTCDEIKNVRNILMRRHHPDHGGDPWMAATINVAYDLLKHSFKNSPMKTCVHHS
jgi:hypothetical protein